MQGTGALQQDWSGKFHLTISLQVLRWNTCHYTLIFLVFIKIRVQNRIRIAVVMFTRNATISGCNFGKSVYAAFSGLLFRIFRMTKDHRQKYTWNKSFVTMSYRKPIWKYKNCKKNSLWNMKIISSSLPPFWLAFSLPASLPLPSLLLPCVFHLLPERVIKVINL